MVVQLVLECLVSDCSPVLGVSILKHSGGELQQLFVAELHAILLHARSHHVLKLPMLD